MLTRHIPPFTSHTHSFSSQNPMRIVEALRVGTPLFQQAEEDSFSPYFQDNSMAFGEMAMRDAGGSNGHVDLSAEEPSFLDSSDV